MLAKKWFFVKHWPQRFQNPRQRLPHWTMNASMKVNADIEVKPYSISYRSDMRGRSIDARIRVDVVHFFAGEHLHSFESAFHGLLRSLTCSFRSVPADPSVNLNLLAYGAAQHTTN